MMGHPDAAWKEEAAFMEDTNVDWQIPVRHCCRSHARCPPGAVSPLCTTLYSSVSALTVSLLGLWSNIWSCAFSRAAEIKSELNQRHAILYLPIAAEQGRRSEILFCFSLPVTAHPRFSLTMNKKLTHKDLLHLPVQSKCIASIGSKEYKRCSSSISLNSREQTSQPSHVESDQLSPVHEHCIGT